MQPLAYIAIKDQALPIFKMDCVSLRVFQVKLLLLKLKFVETVATISVTVTLVVQDRLQLTAESVLKERFTALQMELVTIFALQGQE